MIEGDPAAATGGWHCNPRIDLHWRDWGGDSVAFEALSGETFQLEPLAAAAMACFEERPRTLPELVAELAADLGGQADDEFIAAVQEIVERYQQLGWLQPRDTQEAAR